MSSEEHPENIFQQFVDTFTVDEHPQAILMSGGEALLRPRLVRWLAERARESGTKSYLLSGMFFARGKGIPKPIRQAIEAVDHFAASLDVFHEEQVSRQAVLRVLRELVDAGKDVSLQVVGMDDDDPYLAEVVADVRRVLADRVPMLVGHVGSAGRAAEWLERRAAVHQPLGTAPDPCGVAAWPIVTYDGTVIACCNQTLVDLGQRAPAHLVLGRAPDDGWPTIAARCRNRAALRVVRTVGPEVAGARCGVRAGAGYCETCYQLARPEAVSEVERMVGESGFPALELAVQQLELQGGPTLFARRYGSRRYGDLIELGYRAEVAACAG